MVQENNPRPVTEFSNNIVAQSDYDAAVKAICSTFSEFEQQHMDIPEGLDHERIAKIYQQAKESLLRNLNRITNPIADDDFHDYVDQYHFILEDDDDADEEFHLPAIEDELNEEEEEEEIDEEELVDQTAWKDAQKLRTRIRNMSQTVQNVRERILEQCEKGVLASLDHHLMDRIVETVEEEECSIDSTNVLQESLRGLSQILQDPQWTKLPHRIQSVQDTIEAIQKETAADRPMSQTEIAILSQNSEIDETIVEASSKLREDSFETTEADKFTAIDRLAMLGQCF
ncbi:hypothetical protein IV203_017078 [Nitzschia inconspicua]|uniref:Uncharacterized protein n=1 Tax=Nitzschia inconspicua TaxID=303405 RepID=A0A9K3PI91_9STRA|nr:hypothetical protein IV203_017078 [Nitzschia inconspicua]